jgi:hypothetical protein
MIISIIIISIFLVFYSLVFAQEKNISQETLPNPTSIIPPYNGPDPGFIIAGSGSIQLLK